MGEIAKYLRLGILNADKEAVVTAVTTYGDPAEFSSQLTSGQTRKGIGVYNNSNEDSGEAYYSFTGEATSGSKSMPIPVGCMANIPIADVEAISLHFFCGTGEIADLRVIEVA